MDKRGDINSDYTPPENEPVAGTKTAENVDLEDHLLKRASDKVVAGLGKQRTRPCSSSAEKPESY